MSGDTPVPPLLAAHVGRELGHSRRVLSAPPEAIRVPSGLNATLYTSGYVECAPTAGSGKGAASGITSSLTSTCPTAGSPRTGTATAPSTGRWCGVESPHQKRCATSARRAGSDPHQHRLAGKSQTRPVVRPLLRGLGGRPPQGVGTRTGGARPVLYGRAVGILHAGLGCGLVSRARGGDARGRALCGARP